MRNIPSNLLYIILGAGILYGLEWIGVEFFNLFTYKTWKSWYSLVFYFPVMIINIIFYNKFHRYIKNKIEGNSRKN
jgi:hypothetical protein